MRSHDLHRGRSDRARRRRTSQGPDCSSWSVSCASSACARRRRRRAHALGTCARPGRVRRPVGGEALGDERVGTTAEHDHPYVARPARRHARSSPRCCDGDHGSHSQSASRSVVPSSRRRCSSAGFSIDRSIRRSTGSRATATRAVTRRSGCRSALGVIVVSRTTGAGLPRSVPRSWPGASGPACSPPGGIDRPTSSPRTSCRSPGSRFVMAVARPVARSG